MKNWLIILTLALGIPFCGSSQTFMNMVRDKVKNCVSHITNKGAGRSLDEVEKDLSKPGELSSPNYNFIISAMIH